MTHPLLLTALDAAEAAAQVQRRWAGRIGVREAALKAVSDFVSEADLEAQRAALAVIRAAHPDHQVLAEEDDDGTSGASGAPLWVVDPIDGTTNFLHGHPMYAVSVAVVMDGRPEAGVVVCPSTSERWWAACGGGGVQERPPDPGLRSARAAHRAGGHRVSVQGAASVGRLPGPARPRAEGIRGGAARAARRRSISRTWPRGRWTRSGSPT